MVINFVPSTNVASTLNEKKCQALEAFVNLNRECHKCTMLKMNQKQNSHPEIARIGN